MKIDKNIIKNYNGKYVALGPKDVFICSGDTIEEVYIKAIEFGYGDEILIVYVSKGCEI
jgi:hypothetical protein